MTKRINIIVNTARGERLIQIGRPICRVTGSHDITRQIQWYIIEEITPDEVELRLLENDPDSTGILFSSEEFNDNTEFAGLVIGPAKVTIPHNRLEGPNSDGQGTFSIWDIDLDFFDISIEDEVIDKFLSLLLSKS